MRHFPFDQFIKVLVLAPCTWFAVDSRLRLYSTASISFCEVFPFFLYLCWEGFDDASHFVQGGEGIVLEFFHFGGWRSPNPVIDFIVRVVNQFFLDSFSFVTAFTIAIAIVTAIAICVLHETIIFNGDIFISICLLIEPFPSVAKPCPPNDEISTFVDRSQSHSTSLEGVPLFFEGRMVKGRVVGDVRRYLAFGNRVGIGVEGVVVELGTLDGLEEVGFEWVGHELLFGV